MDHDDDQVRALLARAVGRQGPPMGVTAEDIVRRGRRIRYRRWGVSLTGGCAVAAVLVMSLLWLPGHQVRPASPPIHLSTVTMPPKYPGGPVVTPTGGPAVTITVSPTGTHH